MPQLKFNKYWKTTHKWLLYHFWSWTGCIHGVRKQQYKACLGLIFYAFSLYLKFYLCESILILCKAYCAAAADNDVSISWCLILSLGSPTRGMAVAEMSPRLQCILFYLWHTIFSLHSFSYIPFHSFFSH